MNKSIFNHLFLCVLLLSSGIGYAEISYQTTQNVATSNCVNSALSSPAFGAQIDALTSFRQQLSIAVFEEDSAIKQIEIMRKNGDNAEAEKLAKKTNSLGNAVTYHRNRVNQLEQEMNQQLQRICGNGQ